MKYFMIGILIVLIILVIKLQISNYKKTRKSIDEINKKVDETKNKNNY